MMGPVLFQELLLGGRRRRLHLLRWVVGGLLWLQLFYLYGVAINEPIHQSPFGLLPARRLAVVSEWHLRLLAWEQFLLVLLVTPAFVAGEITDAKTRGTLQQLLTTDLRSWEIVGGKLLAQGLTLTLLLSLTFPLLCFSAACRGMPFAPVAAQLAGMVVLVFLLGSAGLLASVWCRRTSDAILGVYGVFVGLVLAAWGVQAGLDELAGTGSRGTAALCGRLSGWLSACLGTLRPDYLLEPAWEDDGSAEAGARLLAVTLIWGGAGAACLALAVWRLRPAYARQLESAGQRKSMAAAARPPVGDEPVRWREEYLEGVAPLAALRRVPRWVGLATVSAATLLGMGWLYSQDSMARPPTLMARQDSHLQLGLALVAGLGLAVGIRAATAISGEREGGTWEALLLTPLLTRDILEQKARAILRSATPYLVAYAAPALTLSLLQGLLHLTLYQRLGAAPGQALFYALCDFLLAGSWVAASYIMMSWVAYMGLYCSARARSSWRSLLTTFGQGFCLGLVFSVASNFILGLSLSVFFEFGTSPGRVNAFLGCFCSLVPPLVGLAILWGFRQVAQSNLDGAEVAILRAERTWTVPEGLVRGLRDSTGRDYSGW